MSILLYALASLGLLASYLTWASIKNVPVAYEDEEGFHIVRCDECTRFKKCGQKRLCVLGYPTRPSFFHGRRPASRSSVQGSPS
jgi:hypothetical protein